METRNINTHFREHFFFYIVVLLIVVISIISYYRFIINHDYVVGYEGVCDPATEKCFQGCEDDACTKVYYYSQMVKYAPDLYRECSKDITDCEAANTCLPEDKKCSVTYCNPAVSGESCATITKEPNTQNNNTNNTNI